LHCDNLECNNFRERLTALLTSFKSISLMKCPSCDHTNSKVLETRTYLGTEIRRRRECEKCQARFTTSEVTVYNFPYVKKRDGVREPFHKHKLKKGIQLACLKRPIGLDQIETIVNKVARLAIDKSTKEISSVQLGHFVMKELKDIDDVAYVRFASVYKTFKDVQDFVRNLEKDDQ
jgi:transcriptional repressor NrdR